MTNKWLPYDIYSVMVLLAEDRHDEASTALIAWELYDYMDRMEGGCVIAIATHSDSNTGVFQRINDGRLRGLLPDQLAASIGALFHLFGGHWGWIDGGINK